MKLTGRQFLEKIPFDIWIKFYPPIVYFQKDWCYFTNLWNNIEANYFRNNGFDIILNDGDQEFKKVKRLRKEPIIYITKKRR